MFPIFCYPAHSFMRKLISLMVGLAAYGMEELLIAFNSPLVK